MSLEVLEKFMLEMVPPDCKNFVHDAFIEMKENPMPMAVDAFNALGPVIHNGADENISAAVVNGMMLGINLCYGLGRSQALADRLNDYVITKQRKRGDHIVDFLHERIKRKT